MDKSLKAVIFDFDGTLVDTMGSIWVEYQRVMDIMGLRRITQREFTHHIGRAWDEIITTLWPDVDPREFTSHYQVESEEFKPFPGAVKALKELSKKYVLAIMTSRGEKTLFPGLKKAGLDTSLFKSICFRGGLKYNKPDPRALTQACQVLGVKPHQVVYVGDSIIDARCALDAGAGFVAVLSGGADPEDFREMGVEEIIPSVASLPSALKKRRH